MLQANPFHKPDFQGLFNTMLEICQYATFVPLDNAAQKLVEFRIESKSKCRKNRELIYTCIARSFADVLPVLS
jgi:hypothetical protein